MPACSKMWLGVGLVVSTVMGVTLAEASGARPQTTAHQSSPLRATLEERARSAGVPAQPLLRKLDEGLAKGIPLPRIRGVLDAMLDRLKRGAALSTDFERRALATEALADAIAAGASDDLLSGLLAGGAEAPETQRLAAVFALTDLLESGVEAPIAQRLMSQALRAGLAPSSYSDIAPGVRVQSERTGTTVSQTAQALSDRVPGGEDWGRVLPTAPGLNGRPAPPGLVDNPGRALGHEREGSGPVTRGRADPPGLMREAERQNPGNANGQGNGMANGDANGMANGNANGMANGDANGQGNGNANGMANGNANGMANGQGNGNANGQGNGNANGQGNGNANGRGNGR